MSKFIIYQVLPRYFGNDCRNNIPNGSLSQNGVGKFSAFSEKALDSIRSLGVSYIWYTGVLEHATQTDYSSYGIAKDHSAIVKGKAGSPYAIKDYYDVDPDLADNVRTRKKEFQDLIARTHRAGMGVIIDFVPNHLARQYHSDAAPKGVRDFGADDRRDWSFYQQNNFYYLLGQSFEPRIDRTASENGPYFEYPAKATGNDCFSSCPNDHDWYETVKLNYGVDYQGGKAEHFDPVPDTWNKMLQVLLYWVKQGVDGFRCDMAEMVPAAFWSWVIPQVKSYAQGKTRNSKVKIPDFIGKNPLIFIGEVYNPGLYETYLASGFDYLYDKVGLYDTLKAVVQGNAPAFSITSCWQNLGNKQAHMLNFLENHDEQRIASDFFAGNPRKAFPALVVSSCMNTNPFMLYFGQELGEKGMYSEGFSGCDGRSTIFDYWSIDSVRAWRGAGSYEGSELTEDESFVRKYHSVLLNIVSHEPAIREGLFFDLMYVNGPSAEDGYSFNPACQYAFMRKSDDALILAVSNFSDQPKTVRVKVPLHAFEYFHLYDKALDGSSAVAEDLLTGDRICMPVLPDGFVTMQLPAYGARLWRYHLP